MTAAAMVDLAMGPFMAIVIKDPNGNSLEMVQMNEETERWIE